MDWKKIYGLIILGTFLIATTGCKTTGPFKVKDTVIKGTNLHEVVDSRVRVAYLDPDVDFTNYKKILVRPLNFEKTEIDENYDTSGIRGRFNFEWTEKDKEVLAKIYQEEMFRYLQEKGDFEVVKNPGPDVLTLSVFVLKLEPNAPKDDFMSRGTGSGVTIYTEGAGAITIAANAKDSVSGKTVAEIADVKDATYMWGVNNKVTNLRDVRQMFTQWATQFNSALKNLHMYKVQQ